MQIPDVTVAAAAIWIMEKYDDIQQQIQTNDAAPKLELLRKLGLELVISLDDNHRDYIVDGYVTDYLRKYFGRRLVFQDC